MSTQVQYRRGSTAQHSTFTGAAGEMTIDTSKDTIVVHDGVTAGGFPLAKESDLTTLVAGTDNEIQYKSGGSFAASSNLSFNGSYLKIGSSNSVNINTSGVIGRLSAALTLVGGGLLVTDKDHIEIGNGTGINIKGINNHGAYLGGPVNIVAGSSSGVSQIGGSVYITSGDGTVGGGDVYIAVGVDSTDGDAQGAVNITQTGTSAPAVKFGEAGNNGSNSIGVKSPDSLTTSRTWTLPQDDPSDSAGKFLTTDVSGNMSFDNHTRYQKNRIINGDMRIWQRGFNISYSLPDNTIVYMADRWGSYSTGSTITGSRGSGFESFYSLRVDGAAGNTFSSLFQRIESFNCEGLASNEVTISARIFSLTNMTISVIAHAATAGLDNWSSFSTDISENVSLTAGVWNDVKVTGTMSANAVNGITLSFAVGSGLGASDQYRLVNVQLEKGSVATGFEKRDLGDELQRCARYYEKSYFQRTDPSTSITLNGCVAKMAGTHANHIEGFRFRVEKFATPTMTMRSTNSLTTGTVYDATNVLDLAVTLSYVGTTGVAIINSVGGFTENYFYYFHYTAESEI